MVLFDPSRRFMEINKNKPYEVKKTARMLREICTDFKSIFTGITLKCFSAISSLLQIVVLKLYHHVLGVTKFGLWWVSIAWFLYTSRAKQISEHLITKILTKRLVSSQRQQSIRRPTITNLLGGRETWELWFEHVLQWMFDWHKDTNVLFKWTLYQFSISYFQ